MESVWRARTPNDAIKSLVEHPLLTEAERKRMKRYAASQADRAVQLGAQLLVGEMLPERFIRFLPGVHALWTLGEAALLGGPTIAIVGTRGATTYGKACAMKFAEAFAKKGITVVSGGAFGIDAAAHQSAMNAGGKTVAVLPCGIDQAYPAAHRSLFSKIREGGCLVSQFACGYTPRTDTFLIRNEVVAALSDALLLIEAPERSGAISTANRANDMGKTVFVVPGSIAQPSFKGSHDLIRHGAILVDHPDQVLDDMGWLQNSPSETDHQNLPEIQQKILGLLGAEPMATERIAAQLELDPAQVMSEITMLELEGRVIRGSGGITLAP